MDLNEQPELELADRVFLKIRARRRHRVLRRLGIGAALAAGIVALPFVLPHALHRGGSDLAAAGAPAERIAELAQVLPALCAPGATADQVAPLLAAHPPLDVEFEQLLATADPVPSGDALVAYAIRFCAKTVTEQVQAAEPMTPPSEAAPYAALFQPVVIERADTTIALDWLVSAHVPGGEALLAEALDSGCAPLVGSAATICHVRGVHSLAPKIAARMTNPAAPAALSIELASALGGLGDAQGPGWLIEYLQASADAPLDAAALQARLYLGALRDAHLAPQSIPAIEPAAWGHRLDLFLALQLQVPKEQRWRDFETSWILTETLRGFVADREPLTPSREQLLVAARTDLAAAPRSDVEIAIDGALYALGAPDSAAAARARLIARVEAAASVADRQQAVRAVADGGHPETDIALLDAWLGNPAFADSAECLKNALQSLKKIH